MIYQTLKYCLSRVGLSIFFLMTLGFFALYSLHEIAMPQMVVDDTPIQWGLVFACLSIGFLAPGAIGERRLLRALRELEDIDLESDEKQIHRRFDKLFFLTHSFYFLPAQGEWFRQRLILCYANYLLAIGREDPDAFRVYLKAFLLDPRGSKFRAPLLATLGRGHDLADEEIDLLIVMLRPASAPERIAGRPVGAQVDSGDLAPASDDKDAAMIDHLALALLAKKEFTLRSEPLFLRAVQNKSESAGKIVDFVVPFLLKKERSDREALIFYLHALPYHLPHQEETQKIIGRVYCDGRWRATDGDLHERCGEVFASLDKSLQELIARSVDEKRLAAKLQQGEFFSREDKRALKKLKDRALPRQPDIGHIKGALLRSVWPLIHSTKKVIYSLIDVVTVFRLQSARLKWTIACLLIALVSAGPAVKYLKGRKTVLSQPTPPVVEKLPPPRKGTPGNGRVYTVQLAAVISQSQANRIMDSIRKKGVEGLYVVESKRASGGSWYKIRAGKFANEEAAKRFADNLVESEAIKNYFVISISKKQEN